MKTFPLIVWNSHHKKSLILIFQNVFVEFQPSHHALFIFISFFFNLQIHVKTQLSQVSTCYICLQYDNYYKKEIAKKCQNRNYLTKKFCSISCTKIELQHFLDYQLDIEIATNIFKQPEKNLRELHLGVAYNLAML